MSLLYFLDYQCLIEIEKIEVNQKKKQDSKGRREVGEGEDKEKERCKKTRARNGSRKVKCLIETSRSSRIITEHVSLSSNLVRSDISFIHFLQ